MSLTKSYNHSYWEVKQVFQPYDLIIIGAGIVGLSTAISFKQKNKRAKVVVLEKGFYLDGASIKNAGFACFGSAGELLADLKLTNENSVWQTVSMRLQGLNLLRKRLGDKNIHYEAVGGFELFDDEEKFESALNKLPYLNKSLFEQVQIKKCFVNDVNTGLLFNGIKGVIKNNFEGQIDTGLMMENLRHLAFKLGIKILNGVTVESLNDIGLKVEIKSSVGNFEGSKVAVCTNGFSRKLIKEVEVEPARAQVLITKPIKGLRIKGTFHFDEGFYYFRNIDDRILLGGGRNLAFKEETTDAAGLNMTIQNRLDKLLREMILPKEKVEVEYRWSGIMGVGQTKQPIIRWHSKNILMAVRMGGMGVAIGSWVGEEVAHQINNEL